jgi:hypothetical protein
MLHAHRHAQIPHADRFAHWIFSFEFDAYIMQNTILGIMPLPGKFDVEPFIE